MKIVIFLLLLSLCLSMKSFPPFFLYLNPFIDLYLHVYKESRLEERLCNYADTLTPAYSFTSDPSKKVAWEFGYAPVTAA